MQVSVNDALPLVSKWIDNVVMPKSTTMQKFVITFALLQRGPALAEMLRPLADKDGMIELNNLKVALEKAGGSIELPYIGWRFDQDDLDKLMELANGNGKA